MYKQKHPERFNEWWRPLTRQGDPSHRHNLVGEAFDAGYEAGKSAALLTLGRKLVEQYASSQETAVAPGWKCPKCLVDRTKESCPEITSLDCPMVGKAHTTTEGLCPECGWPTGHCHVGCTAGSRESAMTEEQAREIVDADDCADGMRITHKGEWVIELTGGPFTADQLEAIAIIMRAEART